MALEWLKKLFGGGKTDQPQEQQATSEQGEATPEQPPQSEDQTQQ